MEEDDGYGDEEFDDYDDDDDFEDEDEDEEGDSQASVCVLRGSARASEPGRRPNDGYACHCNLTGGSRLAGYGGRVRRAPAHCVHSHGTAALSAAHGGGGGSETACGIMVTCHTAARRYKKATSSEPDSPQGGLPVPSFPTRAPVVQEIEIKQATRLRVDAKALARTRLRWKVRTAN